MRASRFQQLVSGAGRVAVQHDLSVRGDIGRQLGKRAVEQRDVVGGSLAQREAAGERASGRSRRKRSR